MFYVEISDNLITGKGEGDFKTNEQIEVSTDIYDALTNLPANYVEEGGEIVSVEPFPLPPPKPIPKSDTERIEELEQLVADLASLQLEVLMNG